jgi:transcription termination/antitermination protein NusA
MVRIKLDHNTLSISTIVERLTKAKVKDCFEEEGTLYVIINPGQLGKAIGKGGSVIKKVEEKVNKKVRMIEYSGDVLKFVRNIIYPIKPSEIISHEGNVVIKDSNRMLKSKLIGRDSKNLVVIRRAVQRFFPVNDIKVE